MTDSGGDSVDLGDLAHTWEEIYQEWDGENAEYDRIVLDDAARLSADPGGPRAYPWTLGMVLTAPFLTWLPGEGVKEAALEALRATAAAQSAAACDHASHPYETHVDEDDEDLAWTAVALADETQEWCAARPRSEWRCPRNVAGFARIAQDIIAPGTVGDIPPRLPLEARSDIESLTALLELCPTPGTDVDEEIAAQGRRLSLVNDPDDRPGRVMVVRAVSRHAASGMVRRTSVLDDLVEGLEDALPHFDPGPCAHGPDGHPELPGGGPAAAELGIRLSHPSGRAEYERRRARRGEGAPLGALLCPAFMAATAQESLALLRERRERLFGHRDTARLDAEYLRPDGRLAIEVIVERLRDTPGNEQHAEDLGLWAARRHADATDPRERAVLLLTAYQAMRNAYPDPACPVVEGVLPVLRSVAGAPRPPECAHGGGHPELRQGQFVPAMPHFHAAKRTDAPAPEDAPDGAAWMCPRFLGEVAEEGVGRLESLA